MSERKKYPVREDDYELYEEVGNGVSASVFRALCKPLNEIVAIKILDFEKDRTDLDKIIREVQIMKLMDHPNLLNAHCAFVKDHMLWIVMPYMADGSGLHILKTAFPNGLEETIIAKILYETLKALNYLHQNGHIHRDVKAGNILFDKIGGIKLGDFGVSACLFDNGGRRRNTFTGTPCWMAPEVIQSTDGYDFKADIWSFGITALELAHGHAPFAKYSPMKGLLLTLQNAPPSLDLQSDKTRFTKSFRQMIGKCLVKDPSKRPTATKLLKHPFFKKIRSQSYINKKLLSGLPSLGDQYEALKLKEQALMSPGKMPGRVKEETSQNEYNRGFSGWNFDLEDFKSEMELPDQKCKIFPDDTENNDDKSGCDHSQALL